MMLPFNENRPDKPDVNPKVLSSMESTFDFSDFKSALSLINKG